MKNRNIIKSMELKQGIRILIMAILIGICIFMIYYFYTILETRVIFTHFFYIPIILAIFWWRRNGLFVALFLALCLIFSSSFIQPGMAIANDYLRAFIFLFVAFVCFMLTERIKNSKVSLHESEKKYRTLFESSRDAIMMLAPPNWLFTAGNPATIEMIKAKDEKEFISKGPWELSPEYQPDGQLSSETSRKMIEIAMKNGSHFFEWTHKRFDGEEFPATVLLTRIELKGKKLLQATVRDITERKRAEEELIKHRDHLQELIKEQTSELRESEEKYRTLADNLNVGLYRDTVGPKGNFIEINPALVKIFSYKNKEEVFKLHVSDLYQNPEDRKKFNQKILKTGFVKNEELNLKKKDNSTLICSVSAVAVKDKNGKVKYYDGIIDDITERKQSEKTLRESEKRYKTLFESTIDGLFVIDAETEKIALANQTTVKIYGFDSAEEIVGLSPLDFIHPEDKDRVIRIIEKDMFENNLQQINEYRTITKDGREVWISAVGTRIEYKGRLAGLVSIRDISYRKHAEEELHKYADTQKVLLREVNHRVKNNLSSILGMLRMEENKAEKQGSASSLTLLYDLIGRIQGLATVHDLLTESNWRSLNLSRLCELVINKALTSLHSNIPVALKVSPSSVNVNSNQAHNLTLVINELITNSIKYIKDKEKEIKVNVDIKKSKGNAIIIYRDNGKGYPQEMIEGNFSNVGIGFELIKGLVTHSLNGELKIQNDNGAVTIISFKTEEE